MPFFAHDPPLNRLSLLVCDTCGGVLTHEGATTDKPYRDSLPDDVAPHFDARASLMTIARAAGWTASAAGMEWRCTRCSYPPQPR